VSQNSAGYLMVNGDPIMWTMLNAIKEQQKEIEDLKAEVRKLRSTSRRHRR
jgi:cell division protein FtsL